MSSTSLPIRVASSVIRRIASSTSGLVASAPCWYSSALARSEASGVRSSWLASAKNCLAASWLAARSATDVSILASMPFRAVPSRPTSVRGSCGATRSVRSPAVIRSAWPAIASIGRNPRRSTMITPAQTTSAAAADPMMRMSLSRPTVLFTSLMLVLATSTPPGSGSHKARS